MDILGITEENKDLDMIEIISKDGMAYFFHRFNKLDKETHPDEYEFFCQYFNNYLFESDIWEKTEKEQFSCLALDVLDDTNIRIVLPMIHENNLQRFWDSLLYELNLVKMCKFLEISGVSEHYIKHPTWYIPENGGTPYNCLLLKKLSGDLKLVDNVYHIIFTMLKKKQHRSEMIRWIKDICENVDIKFKPVVSLDSILEIIQFSRDKAKREQEKYNNETLVYFNMLKIFLKIFENGVQTPDDLNKVSHTFITKHEESKEDFNFLTVLFFGLQSMIESCYLFKVGEIKQRTALIEQIEDEMDHVCETFPTGLSPETARILEVFRETIEIERSRKEFLKKEISFRKNCRVIQFYIVSSQWIVNNLEHIKQNDVNDIISNILQFFLTEKISVEEITDKNLHDLFDLCLLIFKDESLTSDPSHKMDSIYICYKNLTSHNIHNRGMKDIESFYRNTSVDFYNGLVNTSIFLKDKLEDYGEAYKLHIYNMIFNLMDYGHFKFRFRTIDDKEKFKRYISILIENTNNSLEYWVNSVKHVKKIQDEGRDVNLRSDEIDDLRNSIERAGVYLKINMKILTDISGGNYELLMCDEIVKKFSNSISYILETLVGARKNELSIKDKELYGFHPLTYLNLASDIIAVFALSRKFIESMGSNCTYSVSNLVKQMGDILGKKGMLYQMRGEILRQFMEKVEKVQEIETARDEIEIPDEFCDPIMQTLIKTPVILPETDIFMDREVICRHLLTEETNPFNREELSIEKLDEYNSRENIKTRIGEFKEKIEAWKKDAEF